MLEIVVPLSEGFNSETGEFVTFDSVKLQLEHSLVSLSKWESVYEKPFLSKDTKTSEEMLGYIKAMLLTPDVSSEVLNRLTRENIQAINEHINAKMTATTFAEIKPNRVNRDVITAEIIYYWMATLGVPIECENWHLNRLLTQIQVINRKNESPKKQSKRDILRRNAELNAQRKAALGTSG